MNFFSRIKVHLLFSEAAASEVQQLEANNTEIQEEIQSEPQESEASSSKKSTTPNSTPATVLSMYSTTYTETDSEDQIQSTVLFEVDDFNGVSNLSHPIEVPPGRSGLSPQLSLNYGSIRGNGWLGVGWDFSVGFIQRRGPKKGVPKYDATKDVFDLHFSGRTPQELVPIGGGEYRLRIEGQYFNIKYYSSGNYWELWDKSGVKMRFGSSVNSRLGRVRDPNSGTDTYRWCLDRVEDPKTNYIEFIYWRDQDQNYTYQIYLQETKYNGQVSGGLVHNHRVIFSLESSNRPDPISYYKAGFRMLTKKRLSSIEVRTNEALVRKYQLQYTVSNSISLLSTITLYGSDGVTSLPPTRFYYQTQNPGFQAGTSWSNTSGAYIRDMDAYGYWSDLIDMNGDGLRDRVRSNTHDGNWRVSFNNGNGFDPEVVWPNPARVPYYKCVDNNNCYYEGFDKDYYIRDANDNGVYADLIDINGDGLPDRVVYKIAYGGGGTDAWTVYFNNKSGFGQGAIWQNSSGYIRSKDVYGYWGELIDMNGDGLPDRVRSNTHDFNWRVSFNNGSGFDPEVVWSNPARVPYYYCVKTETGNIICDYGEPNKDLYMRDTNDNGVYADLIDLNGDGLPDRVVYKKAYEGGGTDAWTAYFNNGSGFGQGVIWLNSNGYIRGKDVNGHWSDPIDMNGDGLPDRVRSNTHDFNWRVSFNHGSGFTSEVVWPNPCRNPLNTNGGYADFWIHDSNQYGMYLELIDLKGNGLPDRVFRDPINSSLPWTVYSNNGPVANLLSRVDNSIGGSFEITYSPSTQHTNTHLPFIVQTVSSYTKKDGRGNAYTYEYDYSGGYFDSIEREFRGFQKVTAYQMADSQDYESMTETWFHQDYFRKGKINIKIITSAEGHTKRVDNTWDTVDVWNTNTKFPRLTQTVSTITDYPTYSYTHQTTYAYDTYLNVKEEHKYGLIDEETIRTYFTYTNCGGSWILSKPTNITVKDSSFNIVSSKWMDYDCPTGNLTKEEICKSDNPNDPISGCVNRNETQNAVTTYQYDTYQNLWKVTEPRGYQTILTYDSTKTFVYETSKCLEIGSCNNNHKTVTEYDLGTGKLKKLIPPHLQGTIYSMTYTYDVFGRKSGEVYPGPDGGWISYTYPNMGNPSAQHVEKVHYIVFPGDPSRNLEHHAYRFYDGLGRTYWESSMGPDGKFIVNTTGFDHVGRIGSKSIPYFFNIDTPYYTFFTYDGLSRVIDIQTPDGYHILTTYQGLKKIVTNQRGYPTAYTYDVHQRLKKIEEPTTPTTTFTEYRYDTLGNLTQVRAAKDASGNNLLGAPITTTMTYDSLSKKRTMNDPDMGNWTYSYDKSGNLTSQTDEKSQTITFNYDGLNRVTQKVYPDRTVTLTYDESTVPYAKGKLTKISDPSGGETKEDLVLEYDLMQRVKSSQKKIGTNPVNWVTFQKTYDSAGRAISTTYPGAKIYSYQYDVAGNLLYLKDNSSGNHLVDYSQFTARGQYQVATFPKPNNISVKSTYTYYPDTGRVHTLITQRFSGTTPTDTYQNLDYQQFDGKGNLIRLVDTLNGITHNHTYDSLDRLLTAQGTGTNPYSQSYTYDRIGNITNKSDVGIYSYNYGNKPHAVQSAGPYTFTYDANGNMTSRTGGGESISIPANQWNYDNKPKQIQKGTATTTFTYDGNGERVKKVSPGQTVLYFGENYETRNGTGIMHVFAGSQRVASVFLNGTTQFYHTNHLGSASVITDQNGNRKEKMEYFPFGTYRAIGVPTGTYDFDISFPDVFYTFTSQEEDDELGLYNFKARLYDPVLGRFISADTIVPHPEDPQSLNRYSYVRNNPLRYIDPSGNEDNDSVGPSANYGSSDNEGPSPFSSTTTETTSNPSQTGPEITLETVVVTDTRITEPPNLMFPAQNNPGPKWGSLAAGIGLGFFALEKAAWLVVFTYVGVTIPVTIPMLVPAAVIAAYIAYIEAKEAHHHLKSFVDSLDLNITQQEPSIDHTGLHSEGSR